MRKTTILSVCIIALVALVTWAPNADAFSNYNANGTGCVQCHPGFQGGPGNPAHSQHVGGNQTTNNCQLCHTTGFDDPSTSSSGDANGQGCMGCHTAEGLRLHHENAGAPPDPTTGLSCAQCHPGDATPSPENTLPVYYARADVNVNDPCQTTPAPPGEDFSGNGFGLDNDGDLAYDANDPDCAAQPECTVNTDCDDGVTCTDDTCDQATGTCVFTPVDANCDNGQFCDGAETCDAVNDCQAGTTPCAPGETCDEVNDVCVPPVQPDCTLDTDCDDGVACTADTCDQATGTCVFTPDDANCDNGQFCDGAETCDAVNDCQAGTAPCAPGDTCDEVNDVCVPPVQPDCTFDTDCDDGVTCTADTCDQATGTCVFTPDDAICDNGQFCDGAETCDAVNDCQAGTAPCAPGDTCDEVNDVCVPPVQPGCTVDTDCDDGVTCTVDTCDQTTGTCVFTPDDAICDNGQFCDGAETCDAANDCQAGMPPCDPATETCDEVNDLCVAEPDKKPVKVKVKVPRFINPKNRGLTPVKLVSYMDMEFDKVTCGDEGAEPIRLHQKYFRKYNKTLAIGKFKTKDLGIECGYKTTITCTGTFADGTEFMGTSNKFKTVGRYCKDKHKDDHDKYCHDDHDKDRHGDHDRDRHDAHAKDRHGDRDKDRHDDHDKDRHGDRDKDRHDDHDKDRHGDRDKDRDRHDDHDKDRHDDDHWRSKKH